jgi:spermidine synthase
MVQPMIGKYLLPWFGGSPSVWTTCLLFFQTLLLAGYAYAHFLQRLEPRRQAKVHVGLLLAAVAVGVVQFFLWVSPILPAASLKPTPDAQPTWGIFRLLLISIGLAYFLLSTSASLLQAWIHRIAPSRSAYFFYIISHTASLLALLSYPFLIEPALTIHTQALLWSGGFVLYVALCSYCAAQLRCPAPAHPADPADDGTPAAASPCKKDYLQWTVLAACGVLMLMSATNQMTLDVPPVPFLWVLPLALYLLSYIIGFVDRLKNLQGLYILMLGTAGVVAWYLISSDIECEMPVQIAGHCFILFFVCLFCHNALYRTRPHPSQLTGFYLCIALGGALGGLFVAVIAPMIFTHYWEYQISLVLAAVLAVLALYRNPRSLLYKIRHAGWPAVIVLAGVITYAPLMEATDSLYTARNFFGTLRVVQTEEFDGVMNTLYHGRIDHGAQYLDSALSKLSTTYYTEESGVGLAIEALNDRPNAPPMRAGMIGLGAGTLATYGRGGDLYRMYDINPQVIALARNPAYFTYLRDSAATIETVLGDARIQLERELRQQGSHRFDLLVLDAFSGDSPPAHLLTKEAFALYLEHLAPDGLIAVHISNRYVNFKPLMRAVMDEFDLHGVLIFHDADFDAFADSTEWVIFSPSSKNMSDDLWQNDTFDEYPESTRIWTDDYSNLISLFW